jgi:hypothetical protein
MSEFSEFCLKAISEIQICFIEENFKQFLGNYDFQREGGNQLFLEWVAKNYGYKSKEFVVLHSLDILLHFPLKK